MLSLFNGISTFVGYFMPKPFLEKTAVMLFNPKIRRQQFSPGHYSKMNLIA